MSCNFPKLARAATRYGWVTNHSRKVFRKAPVVPWVSSAWPECFWFRTDGKDRVLCCCRLSAAHANFYSYGASLAIPAGAFSHGKQVLFLALDIPQDFEAALEVFRLNGTTIE